MWATSNLRHGHGYSLIELLVALSILAALLGLVTPALDRGKALLGGQRTLRDLHSQLLQARSTAIFEQRTIAVQFSAHGFQSPLRRQPQRLADPWRIADADGVPIADATPLEIRFYPDGSTSGGALQLSDGRRRYRLSVTWLTGRVRIDDPASSS